MTVIFLPPSMEPIHQQIVSPGPCCLAFFVMMSNEMLSKAPTISRKALSITSLFSTAYSLSVITWCGVVSVNFLGWLAYDIDVGAVAAEAHPYYACAPIFSSYSEW